MLKWMQTRRVQPAKTTSKKHKATFGERILSSGVPLVSPKVLARCAVRPADSLDAAEMGMLARVEQDLEAREVLRAAREFVRMIRERDEAGFPAWVEAAMSSGIRSLMSFAASLSRDEEAVRAALGTPWSNAQCEGQVTRVKAKGRAMYGRAGFELLRRRVLLA